MTKDEIIKSTVDYVKTKFEEEGSGHDWLHIYRVWNNAKLIAKGEKSDLFIVELGALLHDIADYKFNNGDEKIGGRVTKQWLSKLGVQEKDVEAVVHIVDNVSFKGSSNSKISSIEGKIVQDADRLDAIGAIGIARCFTYGGYKGHPIYDPNIKPRLNMTKEEYKSEKSTQINHFYEKLLLLKDLMNTNTAKEIAIKRNEFMEEYLKEFYLEWNGKR